MIQVLHPSYWYQTNLVPERVTVEQSFWYEILVPVTRAENLDCVPWALVGTGVCLF